MPLRGDEGRKSRRGQMGSPCIGHGEPTDEEARIYVNIVRAERERTPKNTAINYVYAYKTKARAFESIKDGSWMGGGEKQ